MDYNDPSEGKFDDNRTSKQKARDAAHAALQASLPWNEGKHLHPDYIGDGVYVSFDHGILWLHTQRQMGWERIGLEPEEWEKLLAYHKRVVEPLLKDPNAKI